MSRVDILIATYNGEKFLEQQLQSLFKQTFQDFKIIVRDDGSSDGTLKIVTTYANLYPDRIEIMPNNGVRLGSTGSFGALLRESVADYVMFCDQDDYWLEDKIAKSLSLMKELEICHPQLPLMIFTDLKEVDSELNVLSESFMKSQKLFTTNYKSPTKLLALNVVAGCTIMLNRIVKEYVLPIPVDNIVHDQWIAVNVAYYGKIAYLPIPTILYRQHTSNSVGANKVSLKYFLNKLSNPYKQLRIYKTLISNLKFKVNIGAFIYFKSIFSLKRL